MILVDYRVGSRDLLELLPANLVVEAQLDSGDVAFLGAGPGATPWPVAVEIKTISDALDSFHTGRFTGSQLPKLLRDHKRSYFLVEGICQVDGQGFMQIGKFVNNRWIKTMDSKTRFSSFDNWLTSLSEVPTLRIKRSINRDDTVRQILNLYQRWQKSPEQHNSAFGHYEESWQLESEDANGIAIFRQPTFCESVAKKLPGVGKTKAEVIANHFSQDARKMFNAPEEEWLAIPGIGKKMVEQFQTVLSNKSMQQESQQAVPSRR